jgi:hypothetical protein
MSHLTLNNSTHFVTPCLVRLANQLDVVGAHAMADILDKAAFQLTRYAQQTIQQQQQLVERFLNIHAEMLSATRVFSNPAAIPAGMKRLLDQVKELGFAANALKQSILPTGVVPTKAEAIYELIHLADKLDNDGKHVLADVAERAANIMAKFADEENAPFKPGYKSSLSTRYCPDHNGAQAIRISEHTYQCPIDGRVYDYESGYTNYSGQKVPGGSIAAQIPNIGFFALPQRLFDSRQNIMNTIN